MRFSVDEAIGAPAGAVIEAFADSAFYEGLGAVPNIGAPTVLDRVERSERVELRIRYRFTGSLPSAARRVLDPARLTWIDHSTIDITARRIDFTIVPDHYAHRLSCRGRTRFDDDGPQRCRQHVDGDLAIHYPLVARAVERAIVSGIREHLVHEARVVEQFLSGNTGRAGR